MRILYDHQVFSLQNVGGVSRYYLELGRCYAEQDDVDVFFLLGLGNLTWPIMNYTSDHVKAMYLRTNIRPGMFRYALNEIVSCAVAPWQGRFDIYHSTYYRSIPWSRSQCLVATHHDCIQERYPSLFSDAKRIRRAKRSLYRRADAIICVSEASRNDLLRYYDIDASKTHIIHHGLSELTPTEAAMAEIRKSQIRPYLLYVGARAPHKNFEGLLAAFRHGNAYKECDLVVVGGGKPTAKEIATIRELRIEEAVKFRAFVTDAILAAAYSNAHLLVYPSLYEGFGFPPLEAMSLGCPSLVANISSLPEICDNGAFYFEPQSEESMIHSLTVAIEDRSQRDQIIADGKTVSSKYKWQKCADKTMELYRHITSAR